MYTDKLINWNDMESTFFFITLKIQIELKDEFLPD